MRPISHFRHLMSSLVTIEARSTQGSGSAPPTYATGVTYRAHLAGERKLVRNAAGQEVVSSQSVYLCTADPILTTARITLSTGDVGSTQAGQIQPPILAVERRFDGRGPHSVVLRLA